MISLDLAEHMSETSLETSWDTECHYDFLHVFDGLDPGNRSTLASMAGVHSPGPIVSRSGQMLVRWYSDANYLIQNRRAIQAEYRIESCPSECGGHGTCSPDTGTCTCGEEWWGPDCSRQRCPASCLDGTLPGCLSAPGPQCGW